MKPNIIYQIYNRNDNSIQGAYDRSYRTEYDFDSVESARSANVHGIYKNKVQYRIAKYKVTYELIDPDVDPATIADLRAEQERKQRVQEYEQIMKSMGHL